MNFLKILNTICGVFVCSALTISCYAKTFEVVDTPTIPDPVSLERESRVVCEGFGEKASRPPIYMYSEVDGGLSTLEVDSSQVGEGLKRRAYKKSVLSSEEQGSLCATGYTIKAFPKWVTDVANDHGKATSHSDQKVFVAEPNVSAQTTLPSSFTITLYQFYPGYWKVAGNFWVPGNLPASSYGQYSIFTLETANFATNLNVNGHLVHSLLTHVPSGQTSQGFSGAGIIIGKFPGLASCNGGNPMVSLIETWRMGIPGATGNAANYRNWLYTSPTASSGSVNGGVAGGNTCFPTADGVKRSYTTLAYTNGAASYQVYNGVYVYGSPSNVMIYGSPGIQNPWGTFYPGYKGIMFLAAAQGESPWSLYFTNVTSGVGQ